MRGCPQKAAKPLRMNQGLFFHKNQSAGCWSRFDPNFSVLVLSEDIYNIFLALRDEKIPAAKVRGLNVSPFYKVNQGCFGVFEL